MADDIEKKLDQILITLNRIEPPVMRLGVEDADTAIRLLAPSEIAYIISKNEDDRRRQTGEPTPPPVELAAAGDDSQVVYTIDGKTYRTFASLTDLTAKFADVPGFLRSHRAYLISMDRITKVKTGDEGRIVFFGEVELYALVSGKNLKEFQAYLQIR